MTAVQRRPTGRIVSVIDKDEVLNLGSANDLHGSDISWHVESRNRLRLQFESDDSPRPTTKLRYDEEAGSFSITVPAPLAYGIHAVGGELEWDAKRGNLYCTVTSRGGDHE